MNEKLLYSLWKAVSDKKNIGTYEEFKTGMQTVADRKAFYDLVSSKGFDLGDYDSYEADLSGVNTPIPNLPKEPKDPNEAIKNAWFSPLYNWAKGRNGQYKLYDKGNSFLYTVYSETTEETDVFTFYKNGDLRYTHSDPSNTKSIINDLGKWAPNSDGKGFTITMDSGDVFNTKDNNWKIAPRVKQTPSTTSAQANQNTVSKDAYVSDSKNGELDYYTNNQNLNENLIKKIVSKHLYSVL